ncbi:mismatch-specific DNA-glycosylase [Asticcacaulis sp. AC466]|uniref:mismatch-specific DNA-glycosylase n=1 Tax=Asticcacaulis sp. AC466 TaxID=1282362 RepID=UPI0004279D1D|nr:mismatch-specific DNA-glycosylase [Asticcacaulis sp. AC466]
MHTMSKLDKFGALPDEHVPDLLAPGLKLVFCGTALGRVSAERCAYYANPGNFFWRTLHNTGLTPGQVRPQDYAQVLDYGIGLTDLCKAHYGNDNQLPAGALDAEALRQKILRYRPAILAFTSKTGASVYLGRATGDITLGFQPEKVGDTRIYVLPSPSGQARIFWNQQAWQDLADTVRGV